MIRRAIILLLICAPQAMGAEPGPPLMEGEFWVDAYSPASGRVRTTLFYVPPTAPARSRIMVIALHGGGEEDTTELIDKMRKTGWNELAQREGIVVAYPTGLKNPDDPEAQHNWNDGRLGTDIWVMPDHADIDDVGYIEELILAAQAHLKVGDRVYVTGISNGGLMSYRLATDPRTNPRIRAIAPIAAQVSRDLAPAGLPAAMPLFLVVGSEDRLMPFNGGPITIQLELEDGTPIGAPILESLVTSATETVELFLAANGCDRERVVNQMLPDTVDDGTQVEFFAFHQCTQTGAQGQQANVAAFVVWGGGHRWQGRGGNGPDQVRTRKTALVGGIEVDYYVTAGLTTEDGFDATEGAWRFFVQH